MGSSISFNRPGESYSPPLGVNEDQKKSRGGIQNDYLANFQKEAAAQQRFQSVPQPTPRRRSRKKA